LWVDAEAVTLPTQSSNAYFPIKAVDRIEI